MELHAFLFLATQFLRLLFISYYPQPATSTPHNNFTDLSSLIDFKAHVTDPYGILATNWTTNTSFCHWTGVRCSRRHQRVTALYLPNFSLQGTISSHLANLSFLTLLHLGNNTLTGPIPEALGRLPRLTKLVLQRNYLSGPIPSNFFNMSSLITIAFATNNLSGSLPANHSDLIMLPRLQWISFSFNQLTGEIPSSFARCLDLQVLSLSGNEFGGTIPFELGNLPELTVLYLGANELNGTIPTSLGNLTKLNSLGLDYNNLEGAIPEVFGNLLNLQYLSMGVNGLTGTIPTALLNASMLNFLELAGNYLIGSVPVNIGKSMPLLTALKLARNHLTGGLDFISSLSNCGDLRKLSVWDNELEGFLSADSIGNLSAHFQSFYASGNNIKGEIPAEFGNLSSLYFLDLGANELTGAIPSALSRLKGLQVINLGGNRIAGSIPFDLGLMTSLNTLHLKENALSGPIPASVRNISMLQHLSLAANTLSSSIPHSLWRLGGLIELDLSENTLAGSLPLEVGNLKTLVTLDLSKNWLSGNIPSALGELQMITYLNLSSNSFHGQIPQSLGGMISVKSLNLSYNSLSGAIPKSLADLRYLSRLDLSFNKLEGQIPKGRVFLNLSIPSLVGNAALCGAPQLGFPPCFANVVTSNSRTKLCLLKYILPAIASFAVLLACFCLLLKFCRRSKAKTPAHNDAPCVNNHRFITYHELVRATDNFCEANLLGRGSYGSVFKGCLDDGLLTAVKVLNLDVEGASKSFDAECHALSTVRHRNLVKIISTCSNLDFKALVLEFMQNGSLEKWLYSHNDYLNLLQRINIMVDVSSALEYLHHHHPHVVVHCDIKPGNVLLDENMIAHVGDFGISKLLLGDSRSVVSAGIPGTIGYMAPEYGSTGKVSRRGDVYSFGILLLETFTRKKPTDALFDGGSSLRQWVCKAYPAAVLEIVDCNLLRNDSTNEQQSEVLATMHRCLSSVIELGLLCSRDSPKERILMKDVVPKLQKIKKEYLSKLPSA